MLASKGKRVVLVDTDPQCNLTGLVLGYKGPTEMEQFYKTETQRNLRSGLDPAFESRPKLIEAVECIPVEAREGLFLLPGHIRLAEYDITLGVAQELTGSIQALRNLPGSISYLLDRTAEKFQADYLLIDMSPSLSSINQNLLMTSDYFIIPTSPDYFSVMALNSLAVVLPRWAAWAERFRNIPSLKDADYPFPNTTPKLLGTIIQKYRPRREGPASAFQSWINQINSTVINELAPILGQKGMLLPSESYANANIRKDYCLAQIADFNSLIATSQEEQTPIYALTTQQIKQGGPVLERIVKSRDQFREVFSDLADKVVLLADS